MHRPASLAAVAALALGACAQESKPAARPETEWEFVPPQEPPPMSHDPIGPPSFLDDAGIVRAPCGDGDDAPRFRMLSAAAQNDVLLGSCGELAWRDAETGALYFADGATEPRKVADGGRPLWLAGEQLLYAGAEGVVLEADGEAKNGWQVSGVVRSGKVPFGDSFWTCSLERGLERLDDEGVTALSADFLHTEYGEGCLAIDVAASGAIAYPTHDHRIGVVDPGTGEKRVLDHPFFPQGTTDADGQARMDVVRVAPDAAFVLHDKRWLETSGDAVGPVGEGELTVVREGPAFRVPGTLGDGWGYGGVATGWSWYGP